MRKMREGLLIIYTLSCTITPPLKGKYNDKGEDKHGKRKTHER